MMKRDKFFFLIFRIFYRAFDSVQIKVPPTVSKNVRDSLLSMVVDTPKDQAMSNLAQSLERGAGTLQTEVRTKIAQFGRSVNMIAADAVTLWVVTQRD